MQVAIRVIATGVFLAAATGVFGQQGPHSLPQNMVQLSASGSVEVVQDLLTIVLNTSRDGSDAAAVQSQLKTALEAALVEAKKTAQPAALELRTGNFSLSLRYGRDGKPAGWQGSTELILEGRDFARISAAAGRIQTLTLGGVSFGLSREQRNKVETQAQALAIERFKARATEIAQGFGFAGYSLGELTVSANDQGYAPRPRMMAMKAGAALAEEPIPVEAGKTAVVVTVSGTVQLK